MNGNIELSPTEVKAIRDGLIAKFYEKNFDEIQTVSPQQVAGILDISIKTLWQIEDLPRIEITSKVVRYKLTDVRDWITKHRTLVA